VAFDIFAITDSVTATKRRNRRESGASSRQNPSAAQAKSVHQLELIGSDASSGSFAH
jgi:hypothetical protein